MRDQLADHLPSIYRFAVHLCGDQHIAEDLAQEAMLRAVRSCESLNDPQSMKIWLLRIVKNLWIDHCRAQSTSPTEITSVVDFQNQDCEPLEQVSQAEEVAMTVAAMHRLPERQKSVLLLIACEELSVAETAEVLQITPEAVRSSLSLARARMRQMLRPGLEANNLGTAKDQFS